MTAGLLGWFTCSLFASVAYSWTFYYLLALIVATRELVRARISAAGKLITAEVDGTTIPAVAFSSKRQMGAFPTAGVALNPHGLHVKTRHTHC
jgi:hypothetical protein